MAAQPVLVPAQGQLGTSAGGDADVVCAICLDGGWDHTNQIVLCDGCDVSVHQSCIGLRALPPGDDPWYCRQCSTTVKHPVCRLCGTDGPSPMQQSPRGWVHIVCVLAFPETYFRFGYVNLSVHGFKDKDFLTRVGNKCYICSKSCGAVLSCAFENCAAKFHPVCGQQRKLWLDLCTIKGPTINYCHQHQHLARGGVFVSAVPLSIVVPSIEVTPPSSPSRLSVASPCSPLSHKSKAKKLKKPVLPSAPTDVAEQDSQKVAAATAASASLVKATADSVVDPLWTFVDGYFGQPPPISTILEVTPSVAPALPPLGQHYSDAWREEDLACWKYHSADSDASLKPLKEFWSKMPPRTARAAAPSPASVKHCEFQLQFSTTGPVDTTKLPSTLKRVAFSVELEVDSDDDGADTNDVPVPTMAWKAPESMTVPPPVLQEPVSASLVPNTFLDIPPSSSSFDDEISLQLFNLQRRLDMAASSNRRLVDMLKERISSAAAGTKSLPCSVEDADAMCETYTAGLTPCAECANQTQCQHYRRRLDSFVTRGLLVPKSVPQPRGNFCRSPVSVKRGRGRPPKRARGRSDSEES